MYGYNVTSLSAVCMRACCVLDKCSHCTLFTFRWLQCLSAFMSTLHIPGRTPHTLYPHNTHLFYRSHYARYHIPFFHNNGLEWSPLSSMNRGESRQGVTHISVIYIDKVNGMECVCTCVCLLQFWFRFRLGFGLLYPLSYPAEIYISGGQSHTPTRQEVVYKELNLKAAPQRMFPFMSSVESDSESESDSELSCFHAIFMACKGQRNGSQLKASHASSLHSPLHFKGVSLFSGNEMRLI